MSSSPSKVLLVHTRPNTQGTARCSDWVTQHPPASIWLPCVDHTGSSALVLQQLESTGCANPVLSCIRAWGIKRTKSSCDVSYRQKGWSHTGFSVLRTQAEKLETSPWLR